VKNDFTIDKRPDILQRLHSINYGEGNPKNPRGDSINILFAANTLLNIVESSRRPIYVDGFCIMSFHCFDNGDCDLGNGGICQCKPGYGGTDC
jgi:hypothetical protein